MRQYQLAPDLKFLDADTLFTENRSVVQNADIQRVRQKELFVLSDADGDKVMLVNVVIHAFLQYFTTPQTLATATEKLAVDAGCTASDIANKTLEFFKDMKDRDVLIPYSATSKPELKEAKASMFTEGQIVDNYKIIECVREKSRVAIYEAQRLTDGQQVALKLALLPPNLSTKKRAKRLLVLQQEFALLRELQGHPNICKFYDLVETDSYNYAVMEYLDGYSLGRFIRDQQPSLPIKLSLVQQFLSVMAHIHQKDILHGDLHSGNIIIEADNLLKIIDLDLANHAKLKAKEMQREGGVIHYIPPERISYSCFDTVDCPADFRSEVFQMGIILYRLIYEKMPFTGFTWRDLTRAIKTEEPEFLTHTPKGESIPSTIISLLKKALAKRREDRFANAQEMTIFEFECRVG